MVFELQEEREKTMSELYTFCELAVAFLLLAPVVLFACVYVFYLLLEVSPASLELGPALSYGICDMMWKSNDSFVD